MITQISASAGSGKTYRLTQLFLSLLEEAAFDPAAPDNGEHGSGVFLAEILAATFTNKAAGEMKRRVVQTLKEQALRDRCAVAQNRPARMGRAEFWVECILRHYGNLNIRTFDSLLTTLVRLCALELNLPPDFQPSFATDEYFTPVYDGLMEDLKADASSGSSLFLTADAAALRAALDEACNFLLFQDTFRGFAPKSRLSDALLELTQRLLAGKEIPHMDAETVRFRLKALSLEVEKAARRLTLLLEHEELQANKRFLKYLALHGARNSIYTPPPKSTFAKKTCLDECLNKISKGKGSQNANSAFMEFRKIQDAFATNHPLLKHALHLALLTLLAREIHARIQGDIAVSLLLPSEQLLPLAEQVLAGEYGVPDALCRLDSRLSRLLLDEFQDTSRKQWAALRPLVLKSLSTGGCLTFVGDTKQAIYGWRGGDARLFDEVAADPGLLSVSPSLRLETLEYNWRSHPALVAHNNAFFSLLENPSLAFDTLSAMLPKGTPEQYTRIAAEETTRIFQRCTQRIPAQKQWGKDPAASFAGVHLYEVEGPNTEAVQKTVNKRLHSLFQKELLPVWKYGDIAVLTRTGEEAALITQWLASWGLPVVTEDSFLLTEHPLVSRLFSFLTFLDYPLDDLAFWEFIHGAKTLIPAGGQDRPEGFFPSPALMLDWLARNTRGRAKTRPPLYQLFRKDFPALWERWIAPFHSGFGLMSAYDLVREIIRRYALLERLPQQAPFLLRFMELAHLAETQGYSSLTAFLEFWRLRQDQEKLPLPESMNAVRVMTIHKAKGLEFPVVVLPFQHNGKEHTPPLTIARTAGLKLLTRADRELEHIYYPACAANEIERLNLLYVSWTRPIYALHAFITRPLTAHGSLARGLKVLLEAYQQQAPPGLCQWEHLTCAPETEEAPGAALASFPDDAPVLPATSKDEAAHSCAPVQADAAVPGWRPMDWLPRLKIFRSPLTDLRLTPERRGSLAHLCLEHLIFSDSKPAPTKAGDDHSATFPPEPEEKEHLRQDVQRAVQQGLRLFPLPLEDPQNAAREMEEGLFWFASLPQSRRWFAHGRREQAIMDRNGNMHRVDLLVDEGPQGVLHAIDYKTGLTTDPCLREEHRKQVRHYMRLLAVLGRPVRGTLIYLDERRIEQVLPVHSSSKPEREQNSSRTPASSAQHTELP